MKNFSDFRAVRYLPSEINSVLLRRIIGTLIVVLLLGAGVAQPARAVELTQAQAIARVRAILRNNTSGCRINKVRSISALRVKAGWRVTARVTMSASGRATAETAVWTVSAKNGAVAANQLTAEIANGCP
jgi:hypothetical protein